MENHVRNNTERGGESILSNYFQLIYSLDIDHYFVCQYHIIMSRNKKNR